MGHHLYRALGRTDLPFTWKAYSIPRRRRHRCGPFGVHTPIHLGVAMDWAVKGEDAPISEVVARIRRNNSESQVFSLKISTPPGGWIGHWLLRFYTRCGAQLKICVEQASIVPTCELSSKIQGAPSVVPDDDSNGFIIELGRAPRRPGAWQWAEVRWRDESTPVGVEFNIDYVFQHRNRIIEFFLNALIWRSKNARCFRVVGP